jgi:hypothetical protein
MAMTDFQRWDYERDKERLKALLLLKADLESQSKAGADTTVRMIKLIQEIEVRSAIIQAYESGFHKFNFLVQVEGNDASFRLEVMEETLEAAEAKAYKTPNLVKSRYMRETEVYDSLVNEEHRG